MWTFETTDCNTKITEIKGKISSITGLATTSALNAVGNKICNASDLVKKVNYNERTLTLRLNMSLHQIIINLRMTYLMQRLFAKLPS